MTTRSFDEFGISEKDEDSYQSDQQVGTMKREVRQFSIIINENS